jgi:hypothetical protein
MRASNYGAQLRPENFEIPGLVLADPSRNDDGGRNTPRSPVLRKVVAKKSEEKSHA